MFSRCSQDVCRIFPGWSFPMKVWTLMIQRNLMIPNYSIVPAIWWSPAIRWSIGSMDFDNPKVYSDTSITQWWSCFDSKNFYHALSWLPMQWFVRTAHNVKGHSEHNWPVKYSAHWPGAWILFKRTARQLLVGQKWVSRPNAREQELYFSGGVFRVRIHLSEGLVGKETSTRDCTRDHSFL